MKEIFPGLWNDGKKLFTENIIPGKTQYAKSIVKKAGKEYREWDPYHSKMAAAVEKGLKKFPIKKGSKLLYLGIASGQTASFFSDIIGKDGIIYGVEISERCMQDLNPVAEARKNIVPILANAKLPEQYGWVEKVDVVYQDVASDDQSEVLIRNCEKFLKPDGFAVMVIKARSMDVVKEPREVYKIELAKLEKHFKITEKIELDPFEKDHMFLVMRWKRSSSELTE